MNSRLCRKEPDQESHLWDLDTGKRIPWPKKPTFHPELPCPNCHRITLAQAQELDALIKDGIRDHIRAYVTKIMNRR